MNRSCLRNRTHALTDRVISSTSKTCINWAVGEVKGHMTMPIHTNSPMICVEMQEKAKIENRKVLDYMMMWGMRMKSLLSELCTKFVYAWWHLKYFLSPSPILSFCSLVQSSIQQVQTQKWRGMVFSTIWIAGIPNTWRIIFPNTFHLNKKQTINL